MSCRSFPQGSGARVVGIARAALLALALAPLAAACEVGAVEEKPPELGESLATGTVYNIHVGGACSTRFTNGKGAARLGQWPGEVSIDAYVDQRDSMSTATANLKQVLDAHCLPPSSCWIFTYSNGSAVASKVLATYDTAWNIDAVLSAGGNEGGSELAGLGWLAEAFGACPLAASSTIRPSAHRNNWNHNDTSGVPILHIAGTGTIWFTLGLSHPLLPGKDDSVVAFHSAGGMSYAGSFSDACAGPKYANHRIYNSRCGGEPENHLRIAGKFVCLVGGC